MEDAPGPVALLGGAQTLTEGAQVFMKGFSF
jgi:hypothetical protein